MTGLTMYAEQKILDAVVSGQALGAPATWYLGLFTALPSDAGGGTEVTGGSYARVAVTADLTQFPAAAAAASGSVKANANAITYPAPTASWGVVVGYGWFDAASSGHLWAWAPLAVSRYVHNGDAPPSFPTGAAAINLD